MSQEDRIEIINNALQAGPKIEFDKFSTLFKTWLEILSGFPEEQRKIMFGNYINEIRNNPEKLVSFNLDGIFAIFMTLPQEQRMVISSTIREIVQNMDEKSKRVIGMIIPQRAKVEIGI